MIVQIENTNRANKIGRQKRDFRLKSESGHTDLDGVEIANRDSKGASGSSYISPGASHPRSRRQYPYHQKILGHTQRDFRFLGSRRPLGDLAGCRFVG